MLGEVHRHLAGPRDRARPPGGVHVGEADVEMLRHPLLDLLDRHAPLVRAQKVLQHFLAGLQRDVAPDQGRMGDDAVERAFQLAHRGGDLVGEEFEHLGRDRDAEMFRLRLQDAHPELGGGSVDVGHQPPAEPRTKPLLHAFQIGRRLVRRHHDLPVVADQIVESMEEFFLGVFLAVDELDIVDHQHVDRPELLLERHRVLETQRADELVHELLGRQVHHAAVGMPLADVPADGMHQVRLAEPDPSVEEEGVVGGGRRLRHPAGRRVGELVGLAHDEVPEDETRIERTPDIPSVAFGRGTTGGRGGGRLVGGFGRPRRRFGGRRGHPFALALRRLGLDLDVELLDRAVLVGPELEDAPGEVLVHIVAHEAGRRRDAHRVSVDAEQGQRLEPAAVGGIADLRAKQSPYPCPLRRSPRVHLRPRRIQDSFE